MKTKLLLVMFLLLGVVGSVKGQTIIADKVKYTIFDGFALVTGYEDGLINADIAESVTDGSDTYPVIGIEDVAFYSCSTLQSITLPVSVTSIGNEAFSCCAGLQDIIVSPGNPYFLSISGVLVNKEKDRLIAYPAGKSGSYQVPDGIKVIDDWAFFSCANLTSITLPVSVTSIGDEAFPFCASLKEFIISPDNPYFTSIDGVLVNKEKDRLIVCPAGKSGSYQVPDGIKVIEYEAFYSCANLTSVILSNSVTSIGNYAFYSCPNLTSITLSNNVTSIGNYAFSYCYTLQSITLPNSVTSIGKWAFSDCSGLTEIYCLAQLPPAVYSIESFYDYSVTLHVPSGSKSIYGTAEVWRNFTDIVDDITTSIDGVEAGSVVSCVDGVIRVQGFAGAWMVQFVSTTGAVVYSNHLQLDGETPVYVGNLPEGFYLLTLNNGEQRLTFKVIKK